MHPTNVGIGFWFGPAGGAAIALVGVLITVFVGLFLSHRTRKWQLQDESRKIAREHGEELYTLITKWGRAQTSWFLKCSLVMRDQIDYNKFLDLHIEDSKGIDLKVEKIEFLISVYFPEVLAEWKNCVTLAHAASKTEIDFKEEYKAGFHRGDIYLAKLAKDVTATQQQIESTLSNLVHHVSAVAKR